MPFSASGVEELQQILSNKLKISIEEAKYFVFTGEVRNNAYLSNEDQITIRFKNGNSTDLAAASDNLNISSLSDTVTKHFLCWHRAAG